MVRDSVPVLRTLLPYAISAQPVGASRCLLEGSEAFLHGLRYVDDVVIVVYNDSKAVSEIFKHSFVHGG